MSILRETLLKTWSTKIHYTQTMEYKGRLYSNYWSTKRDLTPTIKYEVQRETLLKDWSIKRDYTQTILVQRETKLKPLEYKERLY